MIIISENELIHTDSFSDVIEHHGVKGMKWGQPMLYDVARRKTRGMTGSPLSAGSRHMEYTNRVIDDMAKANKQYKKDRKDAVGRHSDGDDKIFKKYGHDAVFSKRDKKGGESRQDHRVRVGEAQKKLANAYVGLNTRYKNDINKANRARAFVNAGGKF